MTALSKGVGAGATLSERPVPRRQRTEGQPGRRDGFKRAAVEAAEVAGMPKRPGGRHGAVEAARRSMRPRWRGGRGGGAVEAARRSKRLATAVVEAMLRPNRGGRGGKAIDAAGPRRQSGTANATGRWSQHIFLSTRGAHHCHIAHAVSPPSPAVLYIAHSRSQVGFTCARAVLRGERHRPVHVRGEWGRRAEEVRKSALACLDQLHYARARPRRTACVRMCG